MQNEKASRTALVIAASLVLLHRDPKHSGLVSKTSADLCAQMLEMHSSQTRLFLKIVRQDWFRPVARLIERITIPGILLHYILRKKCIAGLVRSALINGATQVVIVGAGFDPLSFELHQDFRDAQFWEIDHPATQRHKLRAFRKIGVDRLHFVALDLNATALDKEALIKSSLRSDSAHMLDRRRSLDVSADRYRFVVDESIEKPERSGQSLCIYIHGKAERRPDSLRFAKQTR